MAKTDIRKTNTVIINARLAAIAAIPCVLLIAFYASQNALAPTVLAAEGVKIAAPKAAISEPSGLQVAIFAGGCFWGVEGVYEHSKGVTRVESGYAGGSKADASYDKVSGGRTGHAEAVRLVYDPKKISYNQLLHIFFSVVHDPTQLNRQGPDKGQQYRSAIFPVTAAQKKAASAYIEQLSVRSPWGAKPVTRIESGTFYAAENYHQDYMRKNPKDAYIRTYDAPKLISLKRLFPGVYK
ncbi:MAG: peptide-methionine (S)-S-oxide reductase MsrA [Sphingomonadales bacterium]|nr:peptide-methionine (S)-S-oxide reductase MsrA [Sphingomonadales bacterium]